MTTDPGSTTDPGHGRARRIEGADPEGSGVTVLGYPINRPAEPSPLPDVPTPSVRIRPADLMAASLPSSSRSPTA